MVWPAGWYEKWPQVQHLQVPRLNQNCEDIQVWRTNKGALIPFSLHDAWLALRTNVHKVTWSNHVWFSQCIPKHAYMFWLAVKGRLLTQDRILKWEPNLKSNCPFCEKVFDSRNHLFSDWDFSRDNGNMLES